MFNYVSALASFGAAFGGSYLTNFGRVLLPLLVVHLVAMWVWNRARTLRP